MTTKELIQQLQKHEPDTVVRVYNWTSGVVSDIDIVDRKPQADGVLEINFRDDTIFEEL